MIVFDLFNLKYLGQLSKNMKCLIKKTTIFVCKKNSTKKYLIKNESVNKHFHIELLISFNDKFLYLC